MNTDKKEILSYLTKNIKNFLVVANNKSKDEKYADFLKKNNIKLPLSNITENSVYDYLTDNYGKFCKCGNLNKFKTFWRGYSSFCSKECLHKWRSLKMQGESNNVYRIPNEAKAVIRNKQSVAMKKAIADGRFTPCVTNSWARSRCTVKIIQDSCEKIINCRSSWDAYFQILNPSALYEKLRVQYTYDNKTRNYLVDFIDFENKKIYEIKPSVFEETPVNIIKFNAAVEWAKVNNYEFIVISEEWFKQHYCETNIINQPDYLKMKRLLVQFL